MSKKKTLEYLVPLNITVPSRYIDPVEVPNEAQTFTLTVAPTGILTVTVHDLDGAPATDEEVISKQIYMESIRQVLLGYYYGGMNTQPRPGDYYVRINNQQQGTPVPLAAALVKLVEAVLNCAWADTYTLFREDEELAQKLRDYTFMKAGILLQSLQIIPFSDEQRQHLVNAHKEIGIATALLGKELVPITTAVNPPADVHH